MPKRSLQEEISSTPDKPEQRELSILQLQTPRKMFEEPPPDPKGLHVGERPKKFAPLGAVNLIVLFR